ncbi:MAG: hypothetical protein COA70_13025 [Planctomycetota bacterium]|nr:MAG: hypothetical protein COA70_13025 [Planctomycetota bacterium]
MLAILPLVLALSQLGSTGVYDENGNPAHSVPGTQAAGDILNSYAAGGSPNSGAARNGSTLLLMGPSLIYQVDEATGASLGTISIGAGGFGLGYDSLRDLFVTTDAGLDTVSTFNSAGALVSSWPAPAFGPVGAAYDAGRDVYWICDWQTSTVTSISPTTGASITTWSTAAVGGTRPAGVAFDQANDQVIVGGRDQSAIFVIDAATGALVRSFAAVDGSNNPQGLADSSSGNVWQTSWNSGTVFELDLDNGGGLVLTVSGPCPGLVSVSVTGATANGGVAVAFGNAGSFTIPGGICAGVSLDISSPTLGGIFNADGSGNLSLSRTLGAGLCGLTIQVVDLSTCTVSNTDIL